MCGCYIADGGFESSPGPPHLSEIVQMQTKEVICAHCGKPRFVSVGEYNRQTKRGRVNWFCSDSHAALFYNESRKSRKFVKHCAFCNTPFETFEGKRERTYCSQSCASKATTNVEACRRGGKNSVHGVEFVPQILKKREAFKYAKLEETLTDKKIPHEFEKLIGNRVFDLVFPDKKLCVEFDGPDHSSSAQKKTDNEKDEIAQCNGYQVIRVKCKQNSVIDPRIISPLIQVV